MSQMDLFDQVCFESSRLTANAYSTSFSIGIRCMEKRLRNPIYSIYGFVRFADEIVDTFHHHDKKALLRKLTEDTWAAIESKVSLNPILHVFQLTVHRFGIPRLLIEEFLSSMEMDLLEKHHDQAGFEKYIHGSAGVVGLMCLRVFTDGNNESYERMRPPALKLGSAFQKVNLLRDLHEDYTGLGRTYFPGIDVEKFDDVSKKKIEAGIALDFQEAYEGIRQLPKGARLGVYVAYLYYKALFGKIRSLPSRVVLRSRVQIHNRQKIAILGYSYLKHQLNLI